MRTHRASWLCLPLFGLVTLPAAAVTADELVAKNLAAHGGADKVHALKTLRLDGKLVFPGGFELTAVLLRKAPDKARNEATLQGLTAVQAYDGKDAWQIQPFQGRKDPEKLSSEDAKELADSTDLVNPLVDWKERGSKLEYLGIEDVDGTDAHKLKLTRANGDVTTLYLDPDHFLVIRSVDTRTVRGVEQVTESDYGDYEEVSGVYLPFSVASGPKGSPQKQQLIVEKAVANVDAADALFAFPVKAK